MYDFELHFNIRGWNVHAMISTVVLVIHQNYSKDHCGKVRSLDIIEKQFKVIRSFNSAIDLRIAEAIKIKLRNPLIDLKYNKSFSLLRLFKY